MFETTTCPRSTVSAEDDFYISMYKHYSAGFLPFAGGAADQPNKLLRAMEIIGSRVAENELTNAKKAKSRV